MQNNVPNDDIETRQRQEILQKLSELQEEMLEMRSNMGTLSANINTSLSEGSPDDKFASVVSCHMLISACSEIHSQCQAPSIPTPKQVDNVMKKTRVSRMLQMYMASKGEK